MKKLTTRIAAVIAVVALSVAVPSFAMAGHTEGHDTNSGPLPMAAIGSVFGGAIWIVSTPFCLLLAPTHVLDSFGTLVIDPMKTAIGID